MKVKVKVKVNQDKVYSFYKEQFLEKINHETQKKYTLKQLEGLTYTKSIKNKMQRDVKTTIEVVKASEDELNINYHYRYNKTNKILLTSFKFIKINENETLVLYSETEEPSTFNYQIMGWLIANIFLGKRKHIKQIKSIENIISNI